MTEQVISALWSQGTLVDLDIGRSLFQKRLRDEELRLEGINKSVIHLGNKKLLPEGALDAIKQIESSTRVYLNNHSLSFPISGARFVYYKTLKEVLDFFAKKRDEWDDAVDELIKNFEDLKNKQIVLLDEESHRIMQRSLEGLTGKTLADKTAELNAWYEEQKQNHRNLYPPTNELYKKFRFEWSLFKISAIDGMSALGELEKDELLAAQSKIKEEMQKWVKEASAALHKKLGESAAHAAELLKKQGKLNPKNLKPLFDAFEEFKAVDFTGSSDFHKKIDDLKKKFAVESGGQTDFGKTAEALNNTQAAMDSFKEILGSLSELAVDSVAEKAGLTSLTKVGEFKRLLDV